MRTTFQFNPAHGTGFHQTAETSHTTHGSGTQPPASSATKPSGNGMRNAGRNSFYAKFRNPALDSINEMEGKWGQHDAGTTLFTSYYNKLYGNFGSNLFGLGKSPGELLHDMRHQKQWSDPQLSSFGSSVFNCSKLMRGGGVMHLLNSALTRFNQMYSSLFGNLLSHTLPDFEGVAHTIRMDLNAGMDPHQLVGGLKAAGWKPQHLEDLKNSIFHTLHLMQAGGPQADAAMEDFNQRFGHVCGPLDAHSAPRFSALGQALQAEQNSLKPASHMLDELRAHGWKAEHLASYKTAIDDCLQAVNSGDPLAAQHSIGQFNQVYANYYGPFDPAAAQRFHALSAAIGQHLVASGGTTQPGKTTVAGNTEPLMFDKQQRADQVLTTLKGPPHNFNAGQLERLKWVLRTAIGNLPEGVQARADYNQHFRQALGADLDQFVKDLATVSANEEKAKAEKRAPTDAENALRAKVEHQEECVLNLIHEIDSDLKKNAVGGAPGAKPAHGSGARFAIRSYTGQPMQMAKDSDIAALVGNLRKGGCTEAQLKTLREDIRAVVLLGSGDKAAFDAKYANLFATSIDNSDARVAFARLINKLPA